MILDAYAGPRGWTVGLNMLGLADVGVELDRAACATARAAGHHTIRADATRFPLDHLTGNVEGVILSPPCQAFSSAGNGEGRALLGQLCADVHAGDWAAPRPPAVAHVLQVGRWAETVRPRWVACEQVPAVLPVWQAYAARWRHLFGWSCWAGLLLAADYGVPQTRTRAFLLASAGRTVEPPAPTHCKGGGSTLFGELAPWVSMAQALGWGLPGEPSPVVMTARNRQTGHDVLRGSSWRAEWFKRQQAEGNWLLRAGAQDNATERPINEPAPTVLSSWDNGDTRWQLNRRQQNPNGSPVPPDQPAPTLTAEAGAKSVWQWERPATTVAGDPRITARCHHDDGTQGANAKTTEQVRAGDYDGTEPVKLTLTEALILQSFPPGYPVQGNKSEQFTQVGNAVPPLLAAHVIAAVTGRRLQLEQAA